MTILELAFACYLYNRLTKFDKDYFEFLSITKGKPDLLIEKHRAALIKWLNKWGCRQFAIEYHEMFSNELGRWYADNRALLPKPGKQIWQLSNDELNMLGDFYESLASLKASEKKYKRRGGVNVKVGPTGSAKILFAIRPNAVAPWDEPIRKAKGYNDSKDSYLEFLNDIKEKLIELDHLCKATGMELTSLPRFIDRPGSSVTKLIDEYNWITLTKGWTLPEPSKYKKWFELQSS